MTWSLVIPTFNRAGILSKCLAALENQVSGIAFEVVVVDDGSTDDTAGVLDRWSGRRFALKALRQPNSKPAAARNLGLRHCRGQYVVFLGDDIIAEPNFLAEHARAHADFAREAAVLGYTFWSRELRVTRFMRYLGEQGWQFGYALIQDPTDLPFNFFYTSNISLPFTLIERVGTFDESFGTAGWEDTEYGYRLKQMGGKILFQKTARAEHLHSTTFHSFCARQYRVGQFAPNFFEKHPELRKTLGAEAPLPSPARRLALNLLTCLCGLEDRFQGLDMSRYYPDLMTYHYLRGVHAVQRSRQ